MKAFLKIVAISILITISCASWKSGLNKKGDFNDAIQNAIYDFLNSNSLHKKDDVFSVRATNINKEIIGVSIIGSKNKLFPTSINKIGSNDPSFPTRYMEMNNKLFIWYDSTYTVTTDLISILSRYKHIDSLNVNGIVRIPETTIDDSKEAMDYYFCKSNLNEYKKVKSSIAMGWYDPPNIECNQ